MLTNAVMCEKIEWGSIFYAMPPTDYWDSSHHIGIDVAMGLLSVVLWQRGDFDMATTTERILQALSSADLKQSLYDLAKALRDEGMGQIALYNLFISLLTDELAEDKYDAICDTLDAIWGSQVANSF